MGKGVNKLIPLFFLTVLGILKIFGFWLLFFKTVLKTSFLCLKKKNLYLGTDFGKQFLF